jgi:4-hydroxy-3-polyprenylbenzoate decarboxylase
MDINQYIEKLQAEGELIVVDHFVDPIYEITEITDRISKTDKGGKALLFTNNGTKFPVLMNAMGSDKRMCMVLGVNTYDDVADKINGLLANFMNNHPNMTDKLKMLGKLAQVSGWMPKTVKGKGACQDVIDVNPDLAALPILKCWPADGGRFITFPLVHTRDPHTGIRNVGMYRMQVLDNKTTGMHWHRHKVGARHYEEYKKLNQLMPVSVVLGGDLAYTYAATAPLPDGIDEYILVGFLRNKGVKLVKCITNDLEVPEDADIVIEGYVDPSEDLVWEGPFGDHTGYYSLPDYYPSFHVTCITHKKNAIYPATIVGIPPQEDAYIAKATERIFLAPIKMAMVPEMADMVLPEEGTAHNLGLISIHKTYPGQAFKVMNALWGAGQMMFNKVLAITDADISLNDIELLLKKRLKSFNPDQHLLFSKGPCDVLEHASSSFSYGGKLGFDFTQPLPEENALDSADLKHIDSEKLANVLCDPTVSHYNLSLIENDIPLLILSLTDKTPSNQTQILSSIQNNTIGLKIIVLVDEQVDVFDLKVVAWLVLANFEPGRDTRILQSESCSNSILFIDGTRKMTGERGFNRLWPNVVTSSEQTMSDVDKMWEKLKVGAFIPSPSRKYMTLKFGNEAVVTIDK